MDPNIPSRTSPPQSLEILRKQIGDLHLSLRLPQSQTSSPLGQGLQGLEQLINHAGIGLYRSTVDGQLVMANAVLARIFGYDSPEEMMEDVTDIEKQLYVEPERRKAWCQLFENQEMIGPVLLPRNYRGKLTFTFSCPALITTSDEKTCSHHRWIRS